MNTRACFSIIPRYKVYYKFISEFVDAEMNVECCISVYMFSFFQQSKDTEIGIRSSPNIPLEQGPGL